MKFPGGKEGREIGVQAANWKARPQEQPMQPSPARAVYLNGEPIPSAISPLDEQGEPRAAAQVPGARPQSEGTTVSWRPFRKQYRATSASPGGSQEDDTGPHEGNGEIVEPEDGHTNVAVPQDSRRQLDLGAEWRPASTTPNEFLNPKIRALTEKNRLVEQGRRMLDAEELAEDPSDVHDATMRRDGRPNHVQIFGGTTEDIGRTIAALEYPGLIANPGEEVPRRSERTGPKRVVIAAFDGSEIGDYLKKAVDQAGMRHEVWADPQPGALLYSKLFDPKRFAQILVDISQPSEGPEAAPLAKNVIAGAVERVMEAVRRGGYEGPLNDVEGVIDAVGRGGYEGPLDDVEGVMDAVGRGGYEGPLNNVLGVIEAVRKGGYVGPPTLGHYLNAMAYQFQTQPVDGYELNDSQKEALSHLFNSEPAQQIQSLMQLGIQNYAEKLYYTGDSIYGTINHGESRGLTRATFFETEENNPLQDRLILEHIYIEQRYGNAHVDTIVAGPMDEQPPDLARRLLRVSEKTGARLILIYNNFTEGAQPVFRGPATVLTFGDFEGKEAQDMSDYLGDRDAKSVSRNTSDGHGTISDDREPVAKPEVLNKVEPGRVTVITPDDRVYPNLPIRPPHTASTYDGLPVPETYTDGVVEILSGASEMLKILRRKGVAGAKRRNRKALSAGSATQALTGGQEESGQAEISPPSAAVELETADPPDEQGTSALTTGGEHHSTTKEQSSGELGEAAKRKLLEKKWQEEMRRVLTDPEALTQVIDRAQKAAENTLLEKIQNPEEPTDEDNTVLTYIGKVLNEYTYLRGFVDDWRKGRQSGDQRGFTEYMNELEVNKEDAEEDARAEGALSIWNNRNYGVGEFLRLVTYVTAAEKIY